MRYRPYLSARSKIASSNLLAAVVSGAPTGLNEQLSDEVIERIDEVAGRLVVQLFQHLLHFRFDD